MKHVLCISVLLLGGLMTPVEAQETTIKYFVQLIRGDNATTAPEAGSKPVTGQLAKALSPFNWKNFWEIGRKEVSIPAGKTARVRLMDDFEVEIDTTDMTKRKVTAFREGKSIACNKRPMGDTMTIIGCERDSDSAWFVVVGRDKGDAE